MDAVVFLKGRFLSRFDLLLLRLALKGDLFDFAEATTPVTPLVSHHQGQAYGLSYTLRVCLAPGIFYFHCFRESGKNCALAILRSY